MIKADTIGKVTNNRDPAKAGRVKAQLSELDGKESPNWLLSILPSGWFWSPDVGETVAVQLPDDDDLIEFPDEMATIGTVRDQGDAVPEEFRDNYPDARGFKTPGGHLLIFDDKDQTVTIQVSGGRSKILLKQDGTIEVEGATKVHLKSPLTDLSDTVTDFLLKGDTVKTAFTALFTAWKTAVSAPAPPPVDPNWSAYKAAMVPIITAIESTLGAWLSTKVKTG